MERLETTQFSGLIGVVAPGLLRPGNGVNGFLFLPAMFVIGLISGMMNDPTLAQFAGQAVFALFLARIALNALSGESTGTVFSTVGGGWPEVGGVAARYLTLTAAWLLPVVLIGGAASGASGASEEAMAAAMIAGGDPAAMLPGLGGAMTALTAFALLSTLPPRCS